MNNCQLHHYFQLKSPKNICVRQIIDISHQPKCFHFLLLKLGFRKLSELINKSRNYSEKKCYILAKVVFIEYDDDFQKIS